MDKYDIIIIGAGPGGLTAGIYAGRQGSKTLIIEKDLCGGIGREVPEIENYPGFGNISGLELCEKTKAQAEKVSEIHEMENVCEIIKTKEGAYNFIVKSDKNQYLTKTIILATGSSHRHLNVTGEKEYIGRGVSYCATCDGFFFKDKNVVIVGGGNSAVQEAIYLNNLGCNVTIIHRRDEFRAQKYLQNILIKNNINILYNTTVEEIKGEQLVKNIVIKNVETNEIKELSTDAVFISIGYNPHIELAKQLDIKLDETNHIITDKTQKTNVEYVYAVGDVCIGLKQWIVACGEGAIAATQAYTDTN